MPKRLNKRSKDKKINKRQMISEAKINIQPEYCSQQMTLPMEMIIMVFSHLKSINDIRNCMLLSKEIRNLMLKSSEVMRNIKIQLKCLYETETAMKVLTAHGRYIRCLSIIAKVKSPQLFKDLLCLVPNLEEFLLERRIVLSQPKYPWSVVYSSWLSTLIYESDKDSSESEEETESEIGDFIDDDDDFIYIPPPSKKLMDYWNNDQDSLDMTKLRALKIDVRDLVYFLQASKNVKNLEKLTIFSYGSIYEEFMFDFICRQHNLKELNVINQKNHHLEFPREDPTPRVTFRLKKFKLLTINPHERNENLTKFLNIHADSLEELHVDHSLSSPSLHVVFEKCHKLQKFTLKSLKNSEIYSRSHRDWILPNVKHFDDQNSMGLNLDTVLKKFPNIESLRCQYIDDSSKKPNKIKALEVNTMNSICFFRDEIMRNMLSNIKNVEHLVIRDASNSEVLLAIFQHLDVMEKMKTFSFRVNPYTRRVYAMGDNETVPKNYMFYKIMADMEKKVVKVSTYIVHRNKELFDIVVETFKGFEFYEFCFDVTKMERIDIEARQAELMEM
ncbi:uncharacterized protein [Chironomus tepperi]|uniref:uncharacterized protein isoform X2 n=1 Tax=Chironomus tepperi TaxID=113505 RepID=UPI00391F753F